MVEREPPAMDPDVEAFLADLAHDLRNLLDGVAMSLPADRPPSPSPEHVLQEVTFRNVYDVLRKAEDFLDRSRPRTQREGNAELAPAVQKTLKRLAVFFHDRPVSVSIGDGVTVAIDERALRRILDNVLHVLVKRSLRGSEVRISAGAPDDDTDVVFETAALGAPATVDELFSADFAGGLDLWVSRRATRSYGGDLVADVSPRGLRLVLTLPVSGTADEAADGSVESSPSRPSTTRRRVLVVDDNVDTGQSLAMLLSSAGFEAKACRDGHQALEAFASFAPEAIVLDLALPGIDGWEVCQRLRRERGGKNLLILALSGRGDEETLAAVEKAGFDDHLLKPVDHKRLIRQLGE